ncbi:MAG: FmdB family zinc ribbon protein [Acidimicrobiales bacterium]
MPTYEYACKSCGEHLEVVQSFKEDALTTCPACGGVLRKVFGSIGIAFKGSGFYRTDSRGGATKKESDKDKGADKPAAKDKADKADKATGDKAKGDKGDKAAASPTKADSKTKAPQAAASSG